MIRSFLYAFIFIAFFTNVTKANEWKENKDVAINKAEHLVSVCWEASRDDLDSTNTNRMRAGTLAVAQCMRDYISLIVQTALFQENAKKRAKIEAALEDIWNGTGKFYWILANDNEFCPCGTMMHLAHVSALIDSMEEILKSTLLMVAVVNPEYLKKELP